MARIGRIVIPGQPHHIIQRGNRRQDVFFSDDDRKKYLELLMEESQKAGLKFWAYCLMDNHVHLVAVPENDTSLSRGIGEAHRKYTRYINFREKWRGYLWQGRFSSYPLDEKHLFAVVRYVERNPVRAGLVKNAEDYVWSSAQAHVFNIEDKVTEKSFLTDRINDWAEYLRANENDREIELIRKLSKTGRPLGDKGFIDKLERMTSRQIHKGKPGPRINN